MNITITKKELEPRPTFSWEDIRYKPGVYETSHQSGYDYVLVINYNTILYSAENMLCRANNDGYGWQSYRYIKSDKVITISN